MYVSLQGWTKRRWSGDPNLVRILIQAEGGAIPLLRGLMLMFWGSYLICDTNFEFGEKIYLVFLNNTLSLHPAKESYISQDISSSSAPTCNTCHNRKLVSYTVIHTCCVCMWGMGGGQGRSEARPGLPKGWLAEHWIHLRSGSPLSQGQVSETRIHIQTLFSFLMQSMA